MKTIFESSVTGREGCWPCDGMAEETYIPKELLRGGEIGLPSASELDVVRHFTKLSQRNYGVDGNFYPLGSCTMKYNPNSLKSWLACPVHAPASGTAAIAGRGRTLSGRARSHVRNRAAAGRDHRHGRLHHAPHGRGARRTDRRHAHGRLPQGQGQQENQGHRARLRARHQPCIRRHRRI